MGVESENRKTKKPPGLGGSFAKCFRVKSEFAWGHAAWVLRGKKARKAKVKIGGKTIHETAIDDFRPRPCQFQSWRYDIALAARSPGKRGASAEVSPLQRDRFARRCPQ